MAHDRWRRDLSRDERGYRLRLESRQQHIEALTALGGGAETGGVEFEKTALDQQGEALGRQGLFDLPANDRLEARPRDAVAEPQAHHRRLVPALLAAQGTALGADMALGLDLLEPSLGRAMLAGGTALAVQGQPAMGAGADAHVVAALPIDEIVPASGARPGVVGDLIGGQPAAASRSCVVS